MIPPTALPTSILSSLDVAVFERTRAHEFLLLGEAPEWLPNLWPGINGFVPVDPAEQFTFLEHFMVDAEAAWSEPGNQWAASGPWTEADRDGQDWALEAIAIKSADRNLMLLRFPSADYETLRDILQKSRLQTLEHGRLIKEINKREVLLHCIVHDLSTPLAGIKGSMMLMKNDQMVRPGGEDLLKIGLNQVNKMQSLIREILTTFANDVQPLIPTMITGDAAPSVRLCCEEVITVLSAMAYQKGVTFDVAASSCSVDDAKVIADVARLERVIFNLAENALRFAPEGSRITVAVSDEGESVITTITDQGPGVNDDVAGFLFDKFAKSAQRGGQAGLGLYFCRITVESWGGEIGFRNEPAGGASFWFRIPKPSDSKPIRS